MRQEKSAVENLVQNRPCFYILKLQWEVEDVYELTAAISRNETVRYVFIYDNFFGSLSMGGRKEVLNAIACLSNLESLVYVSKSNRVKMPMSSLATIAKSCIQLTTFELHGPDLVGDANDYKAFSEAVSSLPFLRSFKLLPAYFVNTKLDLDFLFRALATTHSLEELRLCLYCAKGSRLSQGVLESICQMPSLKILDLRWPHFLDEHLKTIAKELRHNMTVEEFRIGGNNLSYSCFDVAEMIEQNVSIRRLCMACRGLGNSECVNALWHAINTNTQVRDVTFENTDDSCNRGSETAFAMQTVLAESHSLRTLRLYNMGLDDDSCHALANGLRDNTSLRELDLRKGNRLISNVGYESLAEMLQQNYTLYSLQTNASGDIRKQIEVCLSLNKSAEKLQEEISISRKHRAPSLLLCCVA